MRTFVKPGIKALAPYLNGNHRRELIENHRRVLKLDSNEATHGLSPRVTSALRDAIAEGPMNWYPDVEAGALREALEGYTGLPPDHILAFNGSDHALETIARAVIASGNEAIIFPPTYDHFRVYVQSCDGKVVASPESEGTTLLDRIAPHVTPRTRLVYLVNPNNPTGFVTPVAEIEAALDAHPDILFVVDEAYFEFCGITAAGLVPRFANLAVTRSFSKAFGLAALRCGYLLANPGFCGEVNKIRVGKHVNALAQIASLAALNDLETMYRYVAEVSAVREWFAGELTSLGVAVKSTPLNFVLARVANPRKVVKHLESRAVYVRDRSGLPGLEGCLRVTVGDRFSMNRFLKIFRTVPADLLAAPGETADVLRLP